MIRLSSCIGTSASGASCRRWMRAANALLFISLASILGGCESDDDGDDDSHDAGSSGTTGTDGIVGVDADTDAGSEPGADGITLSWMVRSLGDHFYDWIEQPGLKGVEVCLIESVDIPCVTSDEQGVFVLSGVPLYSELLLTFTKKDYVPNLVSVRTGTENIDTVDNPLITQPVMIDKNRQEEAFSLLAGASEMGVIWDKNKGSINVLAVDESLCRGPGRLRLTIQPSVGDRAFYWNTDMHIDPRAEKLDEEVPIASFINLDEGEYEIEWELEEPKDMSCGILGHSNSERLGLGRNSLIYGLPAARPNAVRVSVRPGFASGMIVIGCVKTAEGDAGT